MRTLSIMTLVLAALVILTGFNGFWEDYSEQVGRTTVYNTAIGGDVHLIQPVHRSEAEAMVAFAETYNRIAYAEDRSQREVCKDLEQAGEEALRQREPTFAKRYEVKCSPSATAVAPELVMTVWPQVRHNYRFIITFKPTR